MLFGAKKTINETTHELTQFGRIISAYRNANGNFVVGVDIWPYCVICKKEGYGCEHLTNHNEHYFVLREGKVSYENGTGVPEKGDFLLYWPERKGNSPEEKDAKPPDLEPFIEIKKSLNLS